MACTRTPQGKEYNQSLFDALPDEMKLLVMSKMTLKSRLHFTLAYSKYKSLLREISTGNQVITDYDIDMIKSDLEEVLNTQGQSITIQFDKPGTLLKTPILLDISYLMLNLQEVSLINCAIGVSWQRCQMYNRAGCYGFTSGIWRQLLSKVKVFNLDRCTLHYCDCAWVDIKSPHCWIKFLEDLLLLIDNHGQALEINLFDTLSKCDIMPLARMVNRCADKLGLLFSNTCVVFENVEGEALDLNNIVKGGKDLATCCKVFKSTAYGKDGESVVGRCGKITICRRFDGLTLKIMEAFDIDFLKSRLKEKILKRI